MMNFRKYISLAPLIQGAIRPGTLIPLLGFRPMLVKSPLPFVVAFTENPAPMPLLESCFRPNSTFRPVQGKQLPPPFLLA